MAKFGGFMGGGNNMQALMRQAQRMQEEALKAQQEVGLVKVTVKGDKTPVSITIDPSIVDPDDVEMLEDLVLAALNDACSKAEEFKASKMGKFGGMM